MTPSTSINEAQMRQLREDLLDSLDEEFEMELDDRLTAGQDTNELASERVQYFRELLRLQSELVMLQDWVVKTGHRMVILFEGRDAAGKGGVIKRITQRLNPRVCRVAALPAPNDREKTQWYFQRYISHLPAAGEIVLFDRSWYNRAGVERVMGFCNDEEYEEFFRTVPEFEKMLVRSGIQLVKYWFSITDDEQHARFLGRIHDPLKQWKLSPMDLESRRRWEDYTRAKETMIERTHIAEAPWWVVQAVDKKKARLNCIDHLLGQVPYHEIEHPEVTLPGRVRNPDYIRHPVPQDGGAVLEPAHLLPFLQRGLAGDFVRTLVAQVQQHVCKMQAHAGDQNRGHGDEGDAVSASQQTHVDHRTFVAAKKFLHTFERNRVDVPGVAAQIGHMLHHAVMGRVKAVVHGRGQA
jgi:polyphosphate kinase